LADRHSVLIDLDKKERGTRLWQRIVLIGIATALAAATPTPTGAIFYPRIHLASLVLPTGLSDVELTAFPDWLANEAPPPSFRAAVAIRGTTGIASVEGITVVNWTEHGISYRLESLHRTVPELVVLADQLR
jgi:hypothetical protein